jgi:hypothetical protein
MFPMLLLVFNVRLLEKAPLVASVLAELVLVLLFFTTPGKVKIRPPTNLTVAQFCQVVWRGIVVLFARRVVPRTTEYKVCYAQKLRL